MKQKIVLTTAQAVFSIVIAFFATMSIFATAPQKNKVFGSIAALLFLFMAGLPTKEEE